LLDFGSPPFPASDCSRIHVELQDLFRHPGLYRRSYDDPLGVVDMIHDQRLMSYLASIRVKHRGLLESVY
jgi:hypothetical protein